MFNKTLIARVAIIAIVFVLFSGGSTLLAQGGAFEGASQGLLGLYTKATSADVSTSDLSSAMRPFNAAQVQEVVDHWQGVSQETLVKLANDRIGGSPDAAARSALESEKTANLDRFQTAFRAFRDKGGDLSSYQTWYDTVSGLEIDATDASATTQAVLDWAKREDGGVAWAKNLIFALLIFIVFRFIASIAARIVGGAMKRAKINISEGLRRFFIGVVKKVVMLIGVILALSMLGVDVAPLVAALGVGGFVLGFALQDTLGNFAAGIMILMYRPFEIGHVATAAGVTGKVEDINLVSTKFLTPDNQTIIVPNGSVWGGVITNVTGNAQRRVDMVFGIGYDDDIAKAEKVLTEIIEKHPKTLSDPAPTIKLSELADSSVNFICRPWAATADYWDVFFDITREVKERFDQEGLSIPYPQTDVHLHKVE